MLRIRQALQVTGTVEYVTRDTLLRCSTVSENYVCCFEAVVAVLAADTVFRVCSVCASIVRYCTVIRLFTADDQFNFQGSVFVVGRLAELLLT